MIKRPLRSVALAISVVAVSTLGQPAIAEEAPAEFRPTIVVDASETPHLEKWATDATTLCERWYPKLVTEYAAEGAKPAETVTIVFKKEYDGIAATSGAKITIASAWVTQHPDDVGMVIHELMHVVQAYPPSRNKAGWLVEEIADYVRYWQFEPGKKPPLGLDEQSSYKQGYGVAAAFLAWLERVKSPGIVMKLHAALRIRKYDDALFQETTGRSLDDLWAEFVAAGGTVPVVSRETPNSKPQNPKKDE